MTPGGEQTNKNMSSGMMESVTKLPSNQENPIDVVLSQLAVRAAPHVLKAGFSANQVTTLSAVCCFCSLCCFAAGLSGWAAVLWGLGYALDVLDGIVARSKSLGGVETAFGGCLDWVTDVIGYVGVFGIAASKTSHNAFPLLGAALLTLMAAYHMTCQELVSREANNQAHLEITGLRFLPRRCTGKDQIYWTRWFGVGTANLAIIAMILSS